MSINQILLELNLSSMTRQVRGSLISLSGCKEKSTKLNNHLLFHLDKVTRI